MGYFLLVCLFFVFQFFSFSFVVLLYFSFFFNFVFKIGLIYVGFFLIYISFAKLNFAFVLNYLLCVCVSSIIDSDCKTAFAFNFFVGHFFSLYLVFFALILFGLVSSYRWPQSKKHRCTNPSNGCIKIYRQPLDGFVHLCLNQV